MKGFYSDSILDSSIAFRDTMLTKHSLAFSISHHFFLYQLHKISQFTGRKFFFFFEKSLSYSINDLQHLFIFLLFHHNYIAFYRNIKITFSFN